MSNSVRLSVVAQTCCCALLTAALVFPVSAGSKIDTDLQSVIALQGKPCGQVTRSVRTGDNDYVATCSNGSSYRVKVDANGRVAVTPQ